MRHRWIVGIALGISFATFGVACGGGGSSWSVAPSPAVSPSSSTSQGTAAGGDVTTYVKTICGAMSDFTRTSQRSASSLGSIDPSDPASAQKVLVDLIDTEIDGMGSFVQAVQAAGVPPVENGEAAQAAFLQLLQQVRGSFQRYRDDIAALPTNDPTAFSQQLIKLTGTFEKSVQDLSGSLDSFKNPELDAAFKLEPSCSSFTNPS